MLRQVVSQSKVWLLCSFTHVVRSPERLQVRVVECLTLLLGVCEVEAGEGPDVVDVPCFVAVVAPGHAGEELRFEMHAGFFPGATQEFLCGG